MTSRIRRFVVGGLLVLATVAIGLRLAVDEPATQPRCDQADSTGEVNVLRQLRTLEGDYEIELWSRAPFPVRALAPVLRIGDRDFGLSRYGDQGGDLRTLIFSLTAAEYKTVSTGDLVAIYYGFFPDELVDNPDLAARRDLTDGANLWTFGRLDKSRLDCPPRPVPGDD